MQSADFERKVRLAFTEKTKLLLSKLLLCKIQPALARLFRRDEDVTQIDQFRIMLPRKLDSEFSHDDADHVLEFCHGQVRTGATSSAEAEGCPVVVHALCCIEPALRSPLLWFGENLGEAALIVRCRGGDYAGSHLDIRQSDSHVHEHFAI